MTAAELPDMTPDEALAADVALGALGADEQRNAELRMQRDPAFRALVERWQSDLAPLLEQVTDVLPPAALWDRIDAATQPAAKPVSAAAPRYSLWNSLAFWRGLSVGSIAAASVALGLLVAQPHPDKRPLLVATLAATDGTPLITAAYDPARGAVILAPAGSGGDAQHSPELWVIVGDAPPRSLGLIDLANPQAHPIAAEKLRGLKPGAVLAVSIEPLGGSPTGAPTGPVVATGKLAQI